MTDSSDILLCKQLNGRQNILMKFNNNGQKLNKMKPNIVIILILTSYLANTQKQVLELPPCRFTTTASFQLLLCEKQDQCSRQQPSSSTVCNRYSYATIIDQGDCIETCCPDLYNGDGNRPKGLSPYWVQLCYEQYKIRKAVYILSISFGVIFGALFLVAIAYAYMTCFIRNPYTGKKVYVGCWCCKKNINFEQDYKKQMGQLDNESQQSKKNAMEQNEQKKPNQILQ